MNVDPERPRVSAIITTHNRPDTLGEAIASALSQTHPMHEVIVIDDASTVPLETVLERFGSRIIFERLDKNSGANVARNRGVELASGDFVGFLDDDDIWEPEKIEKQLAALGPDDEASLCGYREIETGRHHLLGVRNVDADLLRKGNGICGTTGLMAKRSSMREVEFDPSLKVGQDWDVFVRLCERRPLIYVAAPLFAYRRGNHAGLTEANARRSPSELEELALVIRKHRGWLGETAYRRRLAAMLLKYIGQRKNKLRYVSHALRKAGPRAVIGHFWQKLTPARLHNLRIIKM